MKRWICNCLPALLLSVGLAGSAQAHTIAVGTLNAGAPGSVTIWLGSYHTGAANEGSMTLNGDTMAFNQVSNTLPTGLIAGVNYFYAPGACCTGTAGDYSNATNTTGQAETRWQGVTFSGLSVGNYTYSITGMNSDNWADWPANTNNWTGNLSISSGAVGGVPEPSSVILLMTGLAFAIARRQSKS